MTDGAPLFDSSKVWINLLACVAEHNHDLTRIVARTPIPIVHMAADRFGQTELWPVKIDRSGLSVVLPENGGPRSFIGGQAVVDLRNCGSHLGPSQTVSK